MAHGGANGSHNTNMASEITYPHSHTSRTPPNLGGKVGGALREIWSEGQTHTPTRRNIWETKGRPAHHSKQALHHADVAVEEARAWIKVAHGSAPNASSAGGHTRPLVNGPLRVVDSETLATTPVPCG